MTPTQKLFEQYAYMLDCLANEPECDDHDARKRLLKACANGMREAAIGLFRYEALRICNVNQFSNLFYRNIHGERFDDMVDELVNDMAKKSPNASGDKSGVAPFEV